MSCRRTPARRRRSSPRAEIVERPGRRRRTVGYGNDDRNVGCATRQQRNRASSRPPSTRPAIAVASGNTFGHRGGGGNTNALSSHSTWSREIVVLPRKRAVTTSPMITTHGVADAGTTQSTAPPPRCVPPSPDPPAGTAPWRPQPARTVATVAAAIIGASRIKRTRLPRQRPTRRSPSRGGRRPRSRSLPRRRAG